ncbi:MAG: hypothetical protein M1835_000956 [Candelina submexicana]|nr:MAG: hypothetical protein M1835_000956 [Candelina submexicana]
MERKEPNPEWEAFKRKPYITDVYPKSWGHDMGPQPNITPLTQLDSTRRIAISQEYGCYYGRTDGAIPFATVDELDNWLRYAKAFPPTDIDTQEYKDHAATWPFSKFVAYLLKPEEAFETPLIRSTTPQKYVYTPLSGRPLPITDHGVKRSKPGSYKNHTWNSILVPRAIQDEATEDFHQGVKAANFLMSRYDSVGPVEDELRRQDEEAGTKANMVTGTLKPRKLDDRRDFYERTRELQITIQKVSRDVRKAENENRESVIEAEVIRRVVIAEDKIRKELEETLRTESCKEARETAIAELKIELRDQIEADLREELKTDDLRAKVEKDLRAELLPTVLEIQEKMRATEKQTYDDMVARLRTELKESVQADLKAELRGEMEEAIEAELRHELYLPVEHDLRLELEGDLRAELRSKFEPIVCQAIRTEMEEPVQQQLRKELEQIVRDNLERELEPSIRLELEEELKTDLLPIVYAGLKERLEKSVEKELREKLTPEVQKEPFQADRRHSEGLFAPTDERDEAVEDQLSPRSPTFSVDEEDGDDTLYEDLETGLDDTGRQTAEEWLTRKPKNSPPSQTESRKRGHSEEEAEEEEEAARLRQEQKRESFDEQWELKDGLPSERTEDIRAWMGTIKDYESEQNELADRYGERVSDNESEHQDLAKQDREALDDDDSQQDNEMEPGKDAVDYEDQESDFDDEAANAQGTLDTRFETDEAESTADLRLIEQYLRRKNNDFMRMA